MATVFTVDNTTGTLSITLQPGALNGPGGVQRDSDLRLYGMGALLWGEGVGENFLRITENFASPAKELNDYNPTSGLNDYDPNVDPILPKDQNDLGFGKGVSVPIQGQQWYNTDNGQMYTYDGSGWGISGGISTGTTAPSNPEEGDLWFDTNIPQLKIWTIGSPSSWVSVADRYLLTSGGQMSGDLDMNGNRILNLPTPSNPGDAVSLSHLNGEIATLNSAISGAASNSLPLAGGNMDTGAEIRFDNLEFNLGDGDTSLGADVYTHASGLYVADNQIHMHVDGSNNSDGSFIVSKGSRQIDGNETQLFRIRNDGTIESRLSNYESLVTTDDILPNKKYVDDEISTAASAADSSARSYAQDVFYAQSGVTGNGPRVYIQSGTPSGASNGDIWFKI